MSCRDTNFQKDNVLSIKRSWLAQDDIGVNYTGSPYCICSKFITRSVRDRILDSSDTLREPIQALEPDARTEYLVRLDSESSLPRPITLADQHDACFPFLLEHNGT